MNNDTIFKSSINITTVMESEILPLQVDLKIGLSFDETDPYHQAIALERVRYTINVLFQDSIFGSRKNDLCHQLKELTSTRVAECWDEPWDQFIALLVYYKLTAILEGKGAVEFINISGDTISDDLQYTYYADMLNNEISDDDLMWLSKLQQELPELKTLWYHRSDTSINEDNNPMEMSWETLGLTWNRKPPVDPTTNKDNIRKFEPKLIK